MVLNRTVAPTEEPVTLDQAKRHLRVDHNLDDELITAQIQEGREYAESVLLRSLMSQTWELCLDAWPQTHYIELPRPPLQEVDTFLYVDSEGVEHELDLSDYIVDTRSTPGRLVLPYGGSWPSATLSPDNPIQITYVAGYSSSAAIPGSIKRGILCKVAELYAERGEPVVGSVVTLQDAADRLLGPWRVFRG